MCLGRGLEISLDPFRLGHPSLLMPNFQLNTMNCCIPAFPLQSAQSGISGLDLTYEMVAVGIYVTFLSKALG